MAKHIRSSTISNFLNHAQNSVWVSASGLTRFANKVDQWMKKAERSIISVRMNNIRLQKYHKIL